MGLEATALGRPARRGSGWRTRLRSADPSIRLRARLCSQSCHDSPSIEWHRAGWPGPEPRVRQVGRSGKGTASEGPPIKEVAGFARATECSLGGRAWCQDGQAGDARLVVAASVVERRPLRVIVLLEVWG